MPKHSTSITKEQPRHPVHFHKSGDVILRVENVLFRVHRDKLSRHSKIFGKMFNLKRIGVTEGGKTPKVDLQDDLDQLALLLDFIYQYEIDYKNTERCLRLILLAHKYEAPLVVSTCLDQIKARLPTGATPRDLKALERFRKKPVLLGLTLHVANVVDIPGFLPWAIYLLSTDQPQKYSLFVKSEDDMIAFKKFNKKVDTLRAFLPKLITKWNEGVEEHFLSDECSDEIHPALSAQLARIAIGATPESVDGPDMRSPPPQPQLVLAPARHTTVVTTTTTTTTTYQPISLPALPAAPSSPKDPKLYPLLHAPVPSHLRQFPLTFPNGARAIFKDPSFEPDVEAKRSIRQGTYDEERVGGQGWELLRPEDRVPLAKGKGKAREDVIHLAEAVDRYQLGRQKRVYESDNDMEGVEMAHQTISQAPSMPDLSVMGLVNSPPPRKKARASTIPIPPTTQSLVAPPSPLPSPSGSPSSTPIQLAPPTPPIQPDLTLTTLLALPQLVSHFSALPPNLQSHVLLQLLRQSTLPVLRNVHSVLTPALARDFLTLLPPELTAQILAHLPPSALFAAARVSRAWRQLIDQDMTLWRALLRATRTWFGGSSELAYMTRTLAIRERNPDLFLGRPQPHPFKLLYRRREQTRRNWLYNQPRRLTFPAHGSSVVTCLLFSRNRIISASDDHQIHVYSPTTGELNLRLEGHEGGVWALAVSPNSPSAPHATDSLVSGSTDRTVRIWDLSNGKCTHVFGGHTSTVRCLAIVKPMWIDVNGRKEKWPKRTLIVTGSRDHTLRVWKLPRHGDPEYRCVGADGEDVDPAEDDANRNPYHVRLLSGHTHAVRALAAHGRTLISGSYDTTVRVWDIVTGECKWTLDGHSQKVYSVVLDPQRNQAMSGSMDGTVRIWSLSTGQALHTLTGHSSLVGLLGLSPTHLVSAAADSTLRIWDPQTGALQHTLSAHTGAITCFQHDEFKVLSGSDGTLKMWDVREGSVVRDLLTGITGVWQVVFEGRWCVAASNRQEQTYLDVWDFGGEDPENELEAEEGDWMEASEDESEPEDGDDDIDVVDEGGDLELGDEDEEEDMEEDGDDAHDPNHYRQSGSSLQHRAPGYSSQRRFAALGTGTLPTSTSTRNGIGLGMLGISMAGGAGSSTAPPLPLLDQTPTRPRINRGSRASGSTSSRPY